MSAVRAAKLLCAVALGVLGLALTAAAEPATIQMPAALEIALKPGPGRMAAEINCVLCHSLDYITTQPPQSAAQWRGIVTKMIKVYGASISDEEVRVISEYLGVNYGPTPTAHPTPAAAAPAPAANPMPAGAAPPAPPARAAGPAAATPPAKQ